MIVVDSSALIAIVQSEPDAARLEAALFENRSKAIATPTKFETMLVASRIPTGVADIQLLLASHSIEVRSWTDEMADLAFDAFLRFGKGRHRAALNFGDCMAYALAKSLDAPLLFKGDDFRHTDVRDALA